MYPSTERFMETTLDGAVQTAPSEDVGLGGGGRELRAAWRWGVAAAVAAGAWLRRESAAVGGSGESAGRASPLPVEQLARRRCAGSRWRRAVPGLTRAWSRCVLER